MEPVVYPLTPIAPQEKYMHLLQCFRYVQVEYYKHVNKIDSVG
jgi:hypothetical protein